MLAERERLQLLRLAGLENLAELLLDTGSTANHWPPPCWSPNWTRYGKARSGR